MKLSILLLCLLFLSVRGQRIAGGNPTDITVYPYATALLTNRGVGAYEQACGGTILSNTAILSAASCFYSGLTIDPASWWRARVGSTYRNAGGSIYLIRQINLHSNFSTTTLDNDIAVLRTTLTIAMRPGVVEPARIVGAAYTFGTNQEVWAIGWGALSGANPVSSDQLRHVQIWTINQVTCENRYADHSFTVTSNMVCVGWLDVGVRGQCEGDAGSPLVDNGAVVGLFSWTQGCAQGWYPDINTRISPYTRWIVSTATA
ncbi:hypothetical protein K1T71_012123 [Dendrolimus kikuchii]|uniref:Uncharacterized protein n=1 Tax=Dendrolimus kikuchii TaxID=765133 RepID=A0ACC1CKW8_9NEOP|nr:hypothetical protein K1T71_012123 [Dendrolimus kikuchii]